MRRALLLTACVLCPALAAAESEVEFHDRFIEAIRDNGCHMTEDEAGAKLPQLGFEKDAVFALVVQLQAEGVIELDADKFNLVLHAEGCP